jgi:threonyl-tRNA synthetase
MLSPSDHRSLAQRLDLFHFQDDAPGMVFWHPRGHVLYRLLEDAAREHVSSAGYAEVQTPQLLRRAIWQESGHWDHFRGAMFRVADQDCEAAIKPVSCPGHVQIVKQRVPSYRELPIRLSEFGVVHRDEPSGTLHGLLRLRQFTQDDGHVFCASDQAEGEVERFCRALLPFYAAFGFDAVSVALSTRPDERVGDAASWDQAEAALRSVIARLGIPYSIQPGAGAFYGPKLEFLLRDRLGRSWQCGTIQFDFAMPQRFDVRYVDKGGVRRVPVMLHRALFGSVERFLAVLLEEHGAGLPPWLAPEQIRILPVSAEQLERSREMERQLRKSSLRVSVDARSESLGRRVAEAHEAATPFAIVIGPREVADGTVSVRSGKGRRLVPFAHAVETLLKECARPDLAQIGSIPDLAVRASREPGGI